MAGERDQESTGGSHGGWDQAAETSQVYEAELIALRLREAGIEAEVVDQTFNQEPLPNVRSFAVVRVLVPKEQLAEARRLLDHPEPLPEDAETE
jgi:putative signal transducing protein